MKESRKRELVDRIYNQILDDSNGVDFVMLSPSWRTNYNKINTRHLIPGSFNPFHGGHSAIYNSIKTSDRNKAFELSLTRRNKEDYTPDHFYKVVNQFYNRYYLLITNQAKFIDKTGLFIVNYKNNLRHRWGVVNCHPYFHIGADTLERMSQDYGKHQLNSINAEFTVYPRGNKQSIEDFPFVALNCRIRERFDQVDVSSSNLRDKGLGL